LPWKKKSCQSPRTPEGWPSRWCSSASEVPSQPNSSETGRRVCGTGEQMADGVGAGNGFRDYLHKMDVSATHRVLINPEDLSGKGVAEPPNRLRSVASVADRVSTSFARISSRGVFSQRERRSHRGEDFGRGRLPSSQQRVIASLAARGGGGGPAKASTAGISTAMPIAIASASIRPCRPTFRHERGPKSAKRPLDPSARWRG